MQKKGFTIVELLVVISVLAVITAAGFSLYKTWQDESNLNNGEIILISALNEAKSMAVLGGGDSDWGVKYLPGQVIVFSGSSYVARNATFDKLFYLPSGVTISNLDEFIFTKFTGLPQTTLNSLVNYGGESRQVNVSSQGVLSR